MSLPTPPIVQAVSLGEAASCKGLAAEDADRSVDDRAERGRGRGEGGGGAGRGVGGLAGERRHRRRDQGHAGGDGVVREGDVSERSIRVLKTFGKTFYVGEKPGLAQIAKLANNLLAAAAIVLSSEAMAMGVKAGLDAKVLIDIINAGSGRNSATQDKFPQVGPHRARSTSASRPGCRTRTCACASTRPRRSACRWWPARRCGRCSRSPTRSSAPTPTSPRSRRSSRSGRGWRSSRR